MIHKYISCKAILAKVYSDLSIQQDTRNEDMIEWIGECMELCSLTAQLEPKRVDLNIRNHRAVYPCDMYTINQISYNGRGFRYGTNTSHTHYHKDPNHFHKDGISNDTYIIQPPCIITSLHDGVITLYYNAFRSDEEGYPLVPDLIEFREACLYYIMKKFKTAQMMAGIINANEFEYIKNLSNLWIEKARARGGFPSPDQLESIGRRWQRLVPVMRDRDDLLISSAERQHKGM